MVRTIPKIIFEEAEGGTVGRWRYTIFEGLNKSGRHVYWLNVYLHRGIRSADLQGPQYGSIEQARNAIPNEIHKLGT